jgi:hypothetical protein
MRSALRGSLRRVLALVGFLSLAVASIVPAGAEVFCDALSAQLAALPPSGGGGGQRPMDPARMDAVAQELARAQMMARQYGCTFRLFGVGGSSYCPQINRQIAQLRQQLQTARGGWGGSNWGSRGNSGFGWGDQGNWGVQQARQRILSQMSQYGCEMPQAVGGGYRTLCVRTCDGYYFPISFSAARSRLKIDDAVCQSMYPEGEAKLFVHRTSGEESSSAVSLKGEPYSAQPFAFAYTKEFNPSCRSQLTDGLASLAERFAAAQVAEAAQKGQLVRVDKKGRVTAAPPLPPVKPAVGEDPETLANRGGSFRIEPPDAAPVLVSELNDRKTVRIVGGFFYKLPTEEEAARMNQLKKPPRLLSTDTEPVAAGMVSNPLKSASGSPDGDSKPAVGLP